MWCEKIDQQLRQELQRINRSGMQQAVEMLSRLLRQPVRMELPGALTVDQLATEMEPADPGLGLSLEINGELSGGMLLFFPRPSAVWLSSQLLGADQHVDLLIEPARSTLQEVGNIIASAFLASLDDQLQLRALPSPPKISLAPLARLISQQQPERPLSAPVLCSRLSCAADDVIPLQLSIYLFPAINSLELLLARVSGENS